MLRKILLASFIASSLTALPAMAEEYDIDIQGSHAFIQFKIKHLGYSWLLGRFNQFTGHFSYDEAKPTESKIEVTIKTASIDSNHAERDKHLRGKGFLEVDKYPEARFTSTSFEDKGSGKGVLKGDLTLHGVTKPVAIEVTQVGAGKDPWGGFRRGFEGHTTLTLKDFGIERDLGPASREVELQLFVEGIRK